MERYDVIIVGAGLSGLSGGVYLVDKGKKILILESRAVLGGRTSSWLEKGMEVESGLHRFLGFYEALPDLLKKVGIDIDKILAWEDQIEIRMPDQDLNGVFGLSIFKPLKSMGGLLLNNDFINPIQKAKVGKFFLKGFAEFKKNKKKLDSYTVYEYAKKCGLSDEIITRVLVPLTEGLFFLSVKEYSAVNFFGLFNPYLTKLHKTRVGAFKGGMTDVMINPIAKYITFKGGTIKLNSPVQRLIIKNQKVGGVVVGGKEILAGNVVIATSLIGAQQLLKNRPEFKELVSLKTMPSVTFQLELTKPALEKDRTTFSPETIYSSYSEQSRTTFKKSKGRLSIILASPEQYLEKTDKQILKEIIADGLRLRLNLDKKTIKQFRKVAWAADFCSYEKGTYFKRPSQKTSIEGLYLAGDYTEQDFLHTMEGAVVSGQLAAQYID